MTGAHLLLLFDPEPGRPPADPPGWILLGTGLSGRARLLASPAATSRADLARPSPEDPGCTLVLGFTVQRSAAEALATRLAVRPQAHPPTGVDPGLQGQFVAVHLDELRAGVWSDHLGTTPWYRATDSAGRVVLGTSLWKVAELAGRTRIDDVSAREFIGRGAVTVPFTLLQDVRSLPAGATTWLELRGRTVELLSHSYWVPGVEDAPRELPDAARELRSAVRSFVDAVWSHHERPLLLMSGGEDSRLVAALAVRGRPRGTVRAVILLDQPNRELRLAQAAARVLGVRLEPRWRDVRMYTDNLARIDDIVGPGVDVRHAHTFGLIEPGEADVVVSGYGADYLVKASGWRSTPGLRSWSLATWPEAPDWDEQAFLVPVRALGVQLDEEVAARRRAHVAWLREIRGEHDPEAWSLMWPVAGWMTLAMQTCLQDVQPTAMPFLAGSAMDAIRGIAEDRKLNRALYGTAFARDFGLAGLIPRTDGELPRMPGNGGRALAAGISRAFALRDDRARKQGTLVDPGPWLSDFVVAEQTRQLVDEEDPATVQRALDTLVTGDSATELLAHPLPTVRLRQVIHDCSRVGEAAAGPVDVNPLTRQSSVRNEGGVVLHVDPHDPRGRALVAAGGDLHPIALTMWHEIVASRPWELVVDVGANYGEMVLGAQLPAGAQVVAYEPNAAVLPYLRRSAAGHAPDIEVRDSAVGDRPGRASFTGDGGHAVVRMVTLSSDLRHVDARTACIKIDVDGTELAVLDGAKAWLSSLDDYACQIDILKLRAPHLHSLARDHRLHLWHTVLGRFSRVAPCSTRELQARLDSGAYYLQDALLTPPTTRVKRS